MNLRLTPCAAAIGIALLACAAGAQAQNTVKFDGRAYGGSGTSATFNFAADPRTGAASTGSGSGGGFGITLNGTGSFAAYCVELFEYISVGSTYTGYDIKNPGTYKWAAGTPGLNGWNPARAEQIGSRIGQLWAYADATYGLGKAPEPTNTSKQAASTALQWAIWNVVYDTDNSVSAGGTGASNNFWITQTSANASLITMANSMLTASSTYGQKYNISILTKAGNQDEIFTTGTVTPVPEPGTLALWMTGLAATGFVSRRRRPNLG